MPAVCLELPPRDSGWSITGGLGTDLAFRTRACQGHDTDLSHDGRHAPGNLHVEAALRHVLPGFKLQKVKATWVPVWVRREVGEGSWQHGWL